MDIIDPSSVIAWTQSRNGQDIASGVPGERPSGVLPFLALGARSDAEPAPCQRLGRGSRKVFLFPCVCVPGTCTNTQSREWHCVSDGRVAAVILSFTC
jgi:hypothetical protein